jgi:Tfp pilus assembly protein PilF
VRIAIFVLAAALALLQATPPPDAIQERERAYRANNVGVARLEQFDYDAAARSFREALQIAPALHIARLNLAFALLSGGRPAEGAPEARAAAKQLPDNPTAHYIVGLIAKADNAVEEAAAAFGRVLQLDPRDAGAKIQLGQVQLQQRRYEDALRLFQDALAAEPYNVTAAYSVAIALARAGRAEEGRPAMQRFETLRDSVYGVTYSQVYLGQGRYGEAIASTGAEPELVNVTTPDVTFAEAKDIFPANVPANVRGATTIGGITLFDADGDGDLDLIAIDHGGTRLFRNDRGRFTDDTTRALPGDARATGGAGAIAGDYDNDGRPDLFLLTDTGHRLLHQKADGTFEDAPGTVPATAGARCAAFVDVDHDGDLDIVTAGRAVQLLRNNGNGTFTDITGEAGLAGAPGAAEAIAPADFDNRRDVDMLFVGRGARPALYRNMRDGSFRDSAEDMGLPRDADFIAVAAGDVNKDGYADLFFSAGDARGVFALSDGHGRYRLSAAPDGTRAAYASQFVDYDNDGLLDLLIVSGSGVRMFRNIGRDQWTDVTSATGLPATAGGPAFQSLAIGDIDNDGDSDLLLRATDGTVHAWRNEGGNRNTSLHVTLTARVSNRSGAGAKIEIRAGSLRQTIETSSATPATGPATVLFGLGARPSPDVVRVLWPSGILQAEIPSPNGASVRHQTLTVTELDRKPSSCPYLFTWNGTRFEFVTDFMGGGEMGDWVAPSVWNRPDPDEYVRIRGDQLKPRDGRYELRMTNELEEALFVDRLQLVAVDHRTDTDVYPNEGLRQAPQPFRLTSTRNARPPVHAIDEHGHDVLPQLRSVDRRYPDDFQLLPIRGYAAAHELTLDLGNAAGNAVLLMTGWTDYAFSNDNVAASQSRIEMAPPSLQVKDASGRWRTVIEDVGFPVGRPQTIAVNLAGKFLSSSREIRILTNMRIYWDQILVASPDARHDARMTRLDPIDAQLRWRGFSVETTADGREPLTYDYQHVSATTPWKALAGRYTREGGVRPLLRAVDDMFVISRPGDEIALSFDARALPALPAGWTRTFLLYAYGYSKEMNPRSASPDTVWPLPFRAMTKYPYGPDEHYPDTPALRDYLAHYNTRVVNRSVPSIDAAIPPK